MITTEGWFDWAVRVPGPANKLWPETNTIEAVVFHSAVGTLQGTTNIVRDPLSGRSVTGCIGYDGVLVQYYPVTASPWANGSHAANRRYLGFEDEGGYEGDGQHENTPCTDEQTATQARILADLAAYKGVGIDFWQRPAWAGQTMPWSPPLEFYPLIARTPPENVAPATLIEHREIYATACPSGRIRWADVVAQLQPAPPPAPPAPVPNGWAVEGKQVICRNADGLAVVSIGDFEGLYPGRIAKLFGDQWWWLVKEANDIPRPGGGLSAMASWSNSPAD